MSDINDKSIMEIMETIKSLQEQVSPQPEGGGGWKKRSKLNAIDPQAVSVPLLLETQHGKIRVYIQFPGSTCSTPDALYDLIDYLEEHDFPLDLWRSKEKRKRW